jgi:hypothetical protein
VPFELYKRKMAERPPKIPIFKMLIRKVEYVRANEVHVVVDVQRMDEPGAKEFSRQKGASSLGNRTEWEFEPDGWKCAACGEEPSFILNGRVVRYYEASDG